MTKTALYRFRIEFYHSGTGYKSTHDEFIKLHISTSHEDFEEDVSNLITATKERMLNKIDGVISAVSIQKIQHWRT